MTCSWGPSGTKNEYSCQLAPVQGTTTWFSTHVLIGCGTLLFKQHARSGGDPALQNILNLLRKSNSNENDARSASEITPEHCRIDSSFDEAPKHAM